MYTDPAASIFLEYLKWRLNPAFIAQGSKQPRIIGPFDMADQYSALHLFLTLQSTYFEARAIRTHTLADRCALVESQLALDKLLTLSQEGVTEFSDEFNEQIAAIRGYNNAYDEYVMSTLNMH